VPVSSSLTTRDRFRHRWVPLLLGIYLLLGGSCAHPTDPVDPPNPAPSPTPVDIDPSWSSDSLTIFYTHYYVESTADSVYQLWRLDLSSGLRSFVSLGQTCDTSPDGNHLAFERDGNIFVRDLAMGMETQLTHLGSCFFPAWSPDGTELAYDVVARGSIPPDSAGIWVIRSDATAQRQLVRGSGARMPAWSPDGEAMAFTQPIQSSFPYYEIQVYDLRDSVVRRVTDNNADDLRPAWSPDGTTLAWSMRPGGLASQSELWARAALGGTPFRICPQGTSPSWSPDGKHIAYSGLNTTTNTLTIWIVTLATGDRRAITTP
jgi:Tol biopolymer transport system component